VPDWLLRIGTRERIAMRGSSFETQCSISSAFLMSMYAYQFTVQRPSVSEMHHSFIVDTLVVKNNQQEEPEPLDEKQSNHCSRLL
jgi:hypothetical protein